MSLHRKFRNVLLFSNFLILFVFLDPAQCQYAQFDKTYHTPTVLIRNARFLLGLDNQTPDHFGAAEGMLLKSLDLDPNNKQALQMLADLYAETGDQDLRFRTLQKIVESNPGNDVARLEYQRELLANRYQSSRLRLDQYVKWKEKLSVHLKSGVKENTGSLSSVFARLMFDGSVLANKRGEGKLSREFLKAAVFLDPSFEEAVVRHVGMNMLNDVRAEDLVIKNPTRDIDSCLSLLLSNPSDPNYALGLANAYIKFDAFLPASRWLEMSVSGFSIDSQTQPRGSLLIEQLANVDESVIEKLAVSRWASGFSDKALDCLHERQEVVNSLHKDEFEAFYEEKYGVNPPIGDRTKWRYPISPTLSRLRALIDPDWPINKPTRDPFLRGLKSIEHVVLSYKEQQKELRSTIDQEKLNLETIASKDSNFEDVELLKKELDLLKESLKISKSEGAFWVLFLGWRDHVSVESSVEALKTTVRDVLAHARLWIDELKTQNSFIEDESQNLLELLYQWRDAQYCQDLLKQKSSTLYESSCQKNKEDLEKILENIYQETKTFIQSLEKDKPLYSVARSVLARMALDKINMHPSVGIYLQKERSVYKEQAFLLRDICVGFRDINLNTHHLYVWAKQKLAHLSGEPNLDLNKEERVHLDRLEKSDKEISEGLEKFFSMPNRFLEVRFVPKKTNTSYFEPMLCDIHITNLSSHFLGISNNGPIKPVCMLKIKIIPNDLTGIYKTYEENIPIHILEKLTLGPKEKHTITIDLRSYPYLSRMFNLNELVTYVDGQLKVNFTINTPDLTEEPTIEKGRFGIDRPIPQMLIYGLKIRRQTDKAQDILDKIKNTIQMNVPINVSDIAVLAHAQNLTEQAFLDTKRYEVDQKTFLPQLQRQAKEEFQRFISESSSTLKKSYEQLVLRGDNTSRSWLVDVIPDGTNLENQISKDSDGLVQMVYLMKMIMRSKEGRATYPVLAPQGGSQDFKTLDSLYRIYRNLYKQ